MNLEYLARKRKESKNGRRFLTALDMAIIKKDEAIYNSRARRGLIKKPNCHSICGCGREGCIIQAHRDDWGL
jgi:hypothetical protein